MAVTGIELQLAEATVTIHQASSSASLLIHKSDLIPVPGTRAELVLLDEKVDLKGSNTAVFLTPHAHMLASRAL